MVVTVPTPIDEFKRPELTPLIRASESIGEVLKKGDVVVYESTVYPGCTEEICVPILERVSGLKFNRDFFVGYSPERINPGDKEHRLSTIRKLTSGSTPAAARFFDGLMEGCSRYLQSDGYQGVSQRAGLVDVGCFAPPPTVLRGPSKACPMPSVAAPLWPTKRDGASMRCI
jgi:hypothetical protein